MYAYLFQSIVATLTQSYSLSAKFTYVHFCLTTGLEHSYSNIAGIATFAGISVFAGIVVFACLQRSIVILVAWYISVIKKDGRKGLSWKCLA